MLWSALPLWHRLGKTLTAIKLAEAKGMPVLIIAPNALCEQWEGEIKEKGEKDWEVLVCTSKTKKKKDFQEKLQHLIETEGF